MTGSRFDLATDGFAQGDRYDRARPGYPKEAVDHLAGELRIGPGRRVLDLAAGTGKLTRELVACGADVIAVEPIAGMRDQLGSLAGLRVLDGRAERIPLDAESVDAVTVAQAFHWFDGPAAVAEIHRVLAPDGALGLVWNVMDRSVAWVDRLQEHIHRHRGENPWYDAHGWRVAFEGAPFAPLRHRSFRNAQQVDLAGLLERVDSVSFIGVLDPGAHGAVMDDVAAICRDEGLGRDGERFAIPYVTDVFTTRPEPSR